MSHKPAVQDQLDDYVAAFERAWDEGAAPELGDFLPPRGSSLYLPVLRELVRVDLELSWRERRPRPVTEYLRDYPDLVGDRASVEEIAYEEFRLRVQHGERPSRAEYEGALGVNTAGWFLPGEEDGHGPATTRHDEPSRWLSSARAAAVELAEQSSPAVGQRVAGFVLEAELGRGSFGCVYRARQQDLVARPVALKFLPAQFVNEAHALARLQHTHIVPIYSLHRLGPTVALCMPCFGGQTLAALLSRLGEAPAAPANGAWLADAVRDPAAPLPEALRRLERLTWAETALWLVGRLAEGLAHAHERGILHRDIKPANILLSDEGVPLLLDFNLAENVHEREVAAARAGGTPAYMAPEYLERFVGLGPVASPATDLYALGLVLYQLLARRFPFPTRHGTLETAVPLMVADRQAPPPLADPAVTPGAAAIVRRCLAPRPEGRYARAGELIADIERELAGRPLAHAREPLAGRWRKWRRRHARRIALGGLVALLTAVLLLGAWLLIGVQKQRRLEAAQAHQELLHEMPRIAFLLSSPDAELAQRRDGVAQAEAIAARYGLPDGDPERAPLLRHLNAEGRQATRAALAELLWLWARARQWDGDGLEQARRLNDLALRCAGDQAPAALWRQRAEVCRRGGDEAGARDAEGRLSGRASARDGYLDLLDRARGGQGREALPLLRQLTREDATTPTPWLLLAAAQAEIGRLAEARVSAEVATSLDPSSPWAWYHLGTYCLSAREPEAARTAFTRVLALRPALAEARVNLALALLGLGKPREAERELTRALDQAPEWARIYFIRARARHAAGEEDGAAADHQEGMKREPADEQSYLARSFARLPADPNGALADLDRALALNPRSATGLRNRAHILAEYLARPRDALADLDRALDLRPADQLARAGRAVLRGRLGQRQGAHDDARLIEKEATEAGLIYQAACALALTCKGRPADEAEALRLLRKAFQAEARWVRVAGRDPDLAPLKEAAAFDDLLRKAREWYATAGQ